ncbi:UNVERIFIED_CONTAM: hypothetical protein NY603_27015, partial [Bacteroidetes bacterium 56_B9]
LYWQHMIPRTGLFLSALTMRADPWCSSLTLSVQTSSDFTRLASQYNATNPPNSPTRSSAPSQSTIACPTQDGNLWLASTSLPPTPNHEV